MIGKPVGLPELLDAIEQHVWPHRADPLPTQIQQAARPAEPAGEPQILSASRLQELRTTLPAATLAGLVEDSLTELSERLLVLQEAVGRGDGNQIITHAHAMAGLAAEYGMAAVESQLRTLMRAVRDSPLSAAAVAEALEAEIVRTGAALREAFHIETV